MRIWEEFWNGNIELSAYDASYEDWGCEFALRRQLEKFWLKMFELALE